ncbi:MAG: hypothetical protein WC444_00550 [Candidatus Paceibacterota bacterium]
MPVENLTRQDRKVLAIIMEHLPLSMLSKEEKQAIIAHPADSMEWIANQMIIYAGHSKVQTAVRNHTIDCTVNPSTIIGFTVHSHRKLGRFLWDKDKFADEKFLYLSEGQKCFLSTKGTELYEELKGKPVMNACVSDWLLANPEQIPESWAAKEVFFWGTIYRDSGNPKALYVRYLYWNGAEFAIDYRWLDRLWDDEDPALLYK